jgi:hypothetical protein
MTSAFGGVVSVGSRNDVVANSRMLVVHSHGRRSLGAARRPIPAVDPPAFPASVRTDAAASYPPASRSGLVLGIGLGGFVDGILLHQVLQWHHMLTSTQAYPVTTVAGLEANTLVDGLFHTSTWCFVAVGSWHRAGRFVRGGSVRPRQPRLTARSSRWSCAAIRCWVGAR